MTSQNVHCDPSTSIYSKQAITWCGRFWPRKDRQPYSWYQAYYKKYPKVPKSPFFENFIWGGGHKNDNFERFHELPWSNKKNSEKNFSQKGHVRRQGV